MAEADDEVKQLMAEAEAEDLEKQLMAEAEAEDLEKQLMAEAEDLENQHMAEAEDLEKQLMAEAEDLENQLLVSPPASSHKRPVDQDLPSGRPFIKIKLNERRNNDVQKIELLGEQPKNTYFEVVNELNHGTTKKNMKKRKLSVRKKKPQRK